MRCNGLEGDGVGEENRMEFGRIGGSFHFLNQEKITPDAIIPSLTDWDVCVQLVS